MESHLRVSPTSTIFPLIFPVRWPKISFFASFWVVVGGKRKQGGSPDFLVVYFYQRFTAFFFIPLLRPRYWNDRRSRRVFLCFYSAIFQLRSAKFQTFAYNSRTVGSSNMKFWKQFEINELYVYTKFRGNRSHDFGFRTRKPPRKFGVKSGLSRKRPKYRKKYFIELYVSTYPFIPTNPLLATMRFISFFSLFFPFIPFFSFFFFLIFVRYSSPKPQNIEI